MPYDTGQCAAEVLIQVKMIVERQPRIVPPKFSPEANFYTVLEFHPQFISLKNLPLKYYSYSWEPTHICLGLRSDVR